MTGAHRICNSQSFHAEAMYQRVCQNPSCNRAGPFHAHHAVDKQTLKGWGVPRVEWDDTRNAMRLCEGLDTNRCHFQFENRRIEIPLTALSDDNIEYAFEKGGARAYDHLKREYSGDDPRVELKLATIMEQCP